jgi:hypothetical protein
MLTPGHPDERRRAISAVQLVDCALGKARDVLTAIAAEIVDDADIGPQVHKAMRDASR